MELIKQHMGLISLVKIGGGKLLPWRQKILSSPCHGTRDGGGGGSYDFKDFERQI